jgi:RNA polymerase sigma-70 factor (ECF subfamily)
MSGNALRAEELTHDVFVHAWEKIRQFKGRSSFLTWLYRLAVNHILQEERSRKRASARISELEIATLPLAAEGDGDMAALMDLERALARLPGKARAVVIFHELEGMTHREIAKLVGISPGTSKAQLHRARRLLKEELCQ